MASSEVVLIPAQISELAQKIAGTQQFDEDDIRRDYLEYAAGWITGAAEREYRTLIAQGSFPDDARVVGLLCELAVMRGLVRWHEIKDRPPPMPSISNL